MTETNRSLIEFRRSFENSESLRDRIDYQPHSYGEPFVDMAERTMYIGDMGESGDNRGWPLIPEPVVFSQYNEPLTSKVREALGMFYTYRNGYRLDDSKYKRSRATIKGGTINFDNIITKIPDIELVVSRYPDETYKNRIMLFEKQSTMTNTILSECSISGSVYPHAAGGYAEMALQSKSADELFIDDNDKSFTDFNLRGITVNTLVYLYLDAATKTLKHAITTDLSKSKDDSVIPLVFVKVLYDKYYSDPANKADAANATVDFSFHKYLCKDGETYTSIYGDNPYLGAITDRQLFSLEHLDISGITDGVFEGIEKCVNLKYFYASNTGITNIPELASKFKNLEILDVSNNRFLDISNLDLSNNENLVYLDVSGNKSSGDVNDFVFLTTIPYTEGVEDSYKLRHLDISNTNCVTEHILRLNETLFNTQFGLARPCFKKLAYLDVSENYGIDGPVFTEFICRFGNSNINDSNPNYTPLNTLQYLNVSNTNIQTNVSLDSGQFLDSIKLVQNFFKSLSSIRILKMSGCVGVFKNVQKTFWNSTSPDIGNPLNYLFKSNISGTTYLQHLDVSYCDLDSGFFAYDFLNMASVKISKSLYKLDLSGNESVNDLSALLDVPFYTLTLKNYPPVLSYLDISETGITDNLHFLFNLKNLKVFKMRNILINDWSDADSEIEGNVNISDVGDYPVKDALFYTYGTLWPLANNIPTQSIDFNVKISETEWVIKPVTVKTTDLIIARDGADYEFSVVSDYNTTSTIYKGGLFDIDISNNIQEIGNCQIKNLKVLNNCVLFALRADNSVLTIEDLAGEITPPRRILSLSGSGMLKDSPGSDTTISGFLTNRSKMCHIDISRIDFTSTKFMDDNIESLVILKTFGIDTKPACVVPYYVETVAGKNSSYRSGNVVNIPNQFTGMMLEYFKMYDVDKIATCNSYYELPNNNFSKHLKIIINLMENSPVDPNLTDTIFERVHLTKWRSQEIDIIDISNTRGTDLEVTDLDGIQYISNLVEGRFGNNRINTLDHLECVSLNEDYYHDTGVKDTMFRELVTLDLSNNDIKDVNNLKNAVKLETLDISYNFIEKTKLDGTSYDNFTLERLKNLNVAGNTKFTNVFETLYGSKHSEYIGNPFKNLVNLNISFTGSKIKNERIVVENWFNYHDMFTTADDVRLKSFIAHNALLPENFFTNKTDEIKYKFMLNVEKVHVGNKLPGDEFDEIPAKNGFFENFKFEDSLNEVNNIDDLRYYRYIKSVHVGRLDILNDGVNEFGLRPLIINPNFNTPNKNWDPFNWYPYNDLPEPTVENIDLEERPAVFLLNTIVSGVTNVFNNSIANPVYKIRTVKTEKNGTYSIEPADFDLKLSIPAYDPKYSVYQIAPQALAYFPRIANENTGGFIVFYYNITFAETVDGATVTYPVGKCSLYTVLKKDDGTPYVSEPVDLEIKVTNSTTAFSDTDGTPCAITDFENNEEPAVKYFTHDTNVPLASLVSGAILSGTISTSDEDVFSRRNDVDGFNVATPGRIRDIEYVKIPEQDKFAIFFTQPFGDEKIIAVEAEYNGGSNIYEFTAKHVHTQFGLVELGRQLRDLHIAKIDYDNTQIVLYAANRASIYSTTPNGYNSANLTKSSDLPGIRRFVYDYSDGSFIETMSGVNYYTGHKTPFMPAYFGDFGGKVLWGESNEGLNWNLKDVSLKNTTFVNYYYSDTEDYIKSEIALDVFGNSFFEDTRFSAGSVRKTPYETSAYYTNSGAPNVKKYVKFSRSLLPPDMSAMTVYGGYLYAPYVTDESKCRTGIFKIPVSVIEEIFSGGKPVFINSNSIMTYKNGVVHANENANLLGIRFSKLDIEALAPGETEYPTFGVLNSTYVSSTIPEITCIGDNVYFYKVAYDRISGTIINSQRRLYALDVRFSKSPVSIKLPNGENYSTVDEMQFVDSNILTGSPAGGFGGYMLYAKNMPDNYLNYEQIFKIRNEMLVYTYYDYTNRSQVTIPNLIGVHENEARNILSKLGVGAQIEYPAANSDGSYTIDLENDIDCVSSMGNVIPGTTKIYKNSTIRIYKSRGVPVVDSVVGYDYCKYGIDSFTKTVAGAWISPEQSLYGTYSVMDGSDGSFTGNVIVSVDTTTPTTQFVPLNLIVSGNPSPDVTGTYEFDRMLAGKAVYKKDDDDIYIKWVATRNAYVLFDLDTTITEVDTYNVQDILSRFKFDTPKLIDERCEWISPGGVTESENGDIIGYYDKNYGPLELYTSENCANVNDTDTTPRIMLKYGQTIDDIKFYGFNTDTLCVQVKSYNPSDPLIQFKDNNFEVLAGLEYYTTVMDDEIPNPLCLADANSHVTPFVVDDFPLNKHAGILNENVPNKRYQYPSNILDICFTGGEIPEIKVYKNPSGSNYADNALILHNFGNLSVFDYHTEFGSATPDMAADVTSLVIDDDPYIWESPSTENIIRDYRVARAIRSYIYDYVVSIYEFLKINIDYEKIEFIKTAPISTDTVVFSENVPIPGVAEPVSVEIKVSDLEFYLNFGMYRFTGKGGGEDAIEQGKQNAEYVSKYFKPIVENYINVTPEQFNKIRTKYPIAKDPSGFSLSDKYMKYEDLPYTVIIPQHISKFRTMYMDNPEYADYYYAKDPSDLTHEYNENPEIGYGVFDVNYESWYDGEFKRVNSSRFVKFLSLETPNLPALSRKLTTSTQNYLDSFNIFSIARNIVGKFNYAYPGGTESAIKENLCQKFKNLYYDSINSAMFEISTMNHDFSSYMPSTDSVYKKLKLNPGALSGLDKLKIKNLSLFNQNNLGISDLLTISDNLENNISFLDLGRMSKTPVTIEYGTTGYYTSLTPGGNSDDISIETLTSSGILDDICAETLLLDNSAPLGVIPADTGDRNAALISAIEGFYAALVGNSNIKNIFMANTDRISKKYEEISDATFDAASVYMTRLTYMYGTSYSSLNFKGNVHQKRIIHSMDIEEPTSNKLDNALSYSENYDTSITDASIKTLIHRLICKYFGFAGSVLNDEDIATQSDEDVAGAGTIYRLYPTSGSGGQHNDNEIILQTLLTSPRTHMMFANGKNFGAGAVDTERYIWHEYNIPIVKQLVVRVLNSVKTLHIQHCFNRITPYNTNMGGLGSTDIDVPSFGEKMTSVFLKNTTNTTTRTNADGTAYNNFILEEGLPVCKNIKIYHTDDLAEAETFVFSSENIPLFDYKKVNKNVKFPTSALYSIINAARLENPGIEDSIVLDKFFEKMSEYRFKGFGGMSLFKNLKDFKLTGVWNKNIYYNLDSLTNSTQPGADKESYDVDLLSDNYYDDVTIADPRKHDNVVLGSTYYKRSRTSSTGEFEIQDSLKYTLFKKIMDAGAEGNAVRLLSKLYNITGDWFSLKDVPECSIKHENMDIKWLFYEHYYNYGSMTFKEFKDLVNLTTFNIIVPKAHYFCGDVEMASNYFKYENDPELAGRPMYSRMALPHSTPEYDENTQKLAASRSGNWSIENSGRKNIMLYAMDGDRYQKFAKSHNQSGYSVVNFDNHDGTDVGMNLQRLESPFPKPTSKINPETNEKTVDGAKIYRTAGQYYFINSEGNKVFFLNTQKPRLRAYEIYGNGGDDSFGPNGKPLYKGVLQFKNICNYEFNPEDEHDNLNIIISGIDVTTPVFQRFDAPTATAEREWLNRVNCGEWVMGGGYSTVLQQLSSDLPDNEHTKLEICEKLYIDRISSPVVGGYDPDGVKDCVTGLSTGYGDDPDGKFTTMKFMHIKAPFYVNLGKLGYNENDNPTDNPLVRYYNAHSKYSIYGFNFSENDDALDYFSKFTNIESLSIHQDLLHKIKTEDLENLKNGNISNMAGNYLKYKNLFTKNKLTDSDWQVSRRGYEFITKNDLKFLKYMTDSSTEETIDHDQAGLLVQNGDVDGVRVEFMEKTTSSTNDYNKYYENDTLRHLSLGGFCMNYNNAFNIMYPLTALTQLDIVKCVTFYIDPFVYKHTGTDAEFSKMFDGHSGWGYDKQMFLFKNGSEICLPVANNWDRNSVTLYKYDSIYSKMLKLSDRTTETDNKNQYFNNLLFNENYGVFKDIEYSSSEDGYDFGLNDPYYQQLLIAGAVNPVVRYYDGATKNKYDLIVDSSTSAYPWNLEFYKDRSQQNVSGILNNTQTDDDGNPVSINRFNLTKTLASSHNLWMSTATDLNFYGEVTNNSSMDPETRVVPTASGLMSSVLISQDGVYSVPNIGFMDGSVEYFVNGEYKIVGGDLEHSRNLCNFGYTFMTDPALKPSETENYVPEYARIDGYYAKFKEDENSTPPLETYYINSCNWIADRRTGKIWKYMFSQPLSYMTLSFLNLGFNTATDVSAFDAEYDDSVEPDERYKYYSGRIEILDGNDNMAVYTPVGNSYVLFKMMERCDQDALKKLLIY